jgi:ABC-2 type transport system permease protein
MTIAGRIVRQIGRDRRTLGLIIIVPVVMMTLIGLSFPDLSTLNFIAPALLATIALFFSFLITGISFLRERSQGCRRSSSSFSPSTSSAYPTRASYGRYWCSS